MDGYLAWVKAKGSTEFVLESTLTARPYAPAVGTSESEGHELPFAGSLPETVLGPGEYFVLGDNRPDSSDSRSWGTVRMERIIGPAVLRYFPFRRFGRV
jgi:signal peptidase I